MAPIAASKLGGAAATAAACSSDPACLPACLYACLLACMPDKVHPHSFCGSLPSCCAGLTADERTRRLHAVTLLVARLGCWETSLPPLPQHLAALGVSLLSCC
jgi:hypothetical protein